MSKTRSNHVLPNPNGGWTVKKEGSGRALRVFENREDAIRYARHISIAERSEIVIHSRDGRIRDKDSYGRDPAPAKDRRSRKR